MQEQRKYQTQCTSQLPSLTSSASSILNSRANTSASSSSSSSLCPRPNIAKLVLWLAPWAGRGMMWKWTWGTTCAALSPVTQLDDFISFSSSIDMWSQNAALVEWQIKQDIGQGYPTSLNTNIDTSNTWQHTAENYSMFKYNKDQGFPEMAKSKGKTYHCSVQHSNVCRDHHQTQSSLQPWRE